MKIRNQDFGDDLYLEGLAGLAIIQLEVSSDQLFINSSQETREERVPRDRWPTEGQFVEIFQVLL